MIITLDGPCGSGKSTLAQLLAEKLGFFYINSGYLYRSLAHILVAEFGYDEAALQNLNIEHIAFILHEDNFTYQYQDGIARAFFKGNEITHHLKRNTVSYHASLISGHAKVRQFIIPLQQKFGQNYNLIADGRDGGTEIYPHAQFKFYITASPEVRAQRLHADLAKKGININFEEVLQMSQARDMRDTTRAISPLRKADDAIEIDSSDLSVDQILDYIISIIQK